MGEGEGERENDSYLDGLVTASMIPLSSVGPTLACPSVNNNTDATSFFVVLLRISWTAINGYNKTGKRERGK